jgi:hypothetical protein
VQAALGRRYGATGSIRSHWFRRKISYVQLSPLSRFELREDERPDERSLRERPDDRSVREELRLPRARSFRLRSRVERVRLSRGARLRTRSGARVRVLRGKRMRVRFRASSVRRSGGWRSRSDGTMIRARDRSRARSIAFSRSRSRVTVRRRDSLDGDVLQRGVRTGRGVVRSTRRTERRAPSSARSWLRSVVSSRDDRLPRSVRSFPEDGRSVRRSVLRPVLRSVLRSEERSVRAGFRSREERPLLSREVRPRSREVRPVSRLVRPAPRLVSARPLDRVVVASRDRGVAVRLVRVDVLASERPVRGVADRVVVRALRETPRPTSVRGVYVRRVVRSGAYPV